MADDLQIRQTGVSDVEFPNTADAPSDVVRGLAAPELLALIDAAVTEFQSTELTSLTEEQVAGLAHRFEAIDRKQQTNAARILVEVSDRRIYENEGCLTLHQFYEQRLRLGAGATRRRKDVAYAIGRFTSFQGESLEPVRPATAAAVAAGEIGDQHVLVVDEIMGKIPHRVDDEVKAQAEAQLADAAKTLAPESVTIVGNRLLSYLDPDGELSDDTDRKRRRGFVISPQDRQLMSKVRALLSPALRAKLEVILTKWAAPGMNNPDDPDSPAGADDAPGLDPEIVAAAAERDDRTQGQRNHDALEAMCDWILGHGALGRPDRIPNEIVITVSDEDLARQAGVALTATGTRLPVGDLVDIAAGAVPYLEVFRGHTREILHLGRGRRLASKAQRLALFGRDRGCTAPGCTRPFSRTQAHHFPDWAHGGSTDINHLGAACGGDNRRVHRRRGGWETEIIETGPHAGRVGWRPTGSTGEWQINPIFWPELLGDHPAHAPPEEDPACESGVERLLADKLAEKRAG